MAWGRRGPATPGHRLASDMRLLSIALIACAIAGAGCGQVTDGSPATSSPDSVPTPSPSTASSPESADGISFERPAEWTRWQPNQHNPVNDGPLIYLSTDRLLPSCATTPDATPNPASAEGRACDWPLAELGPNGVLVTWLTTRILQSLAGRRRARRGERCDGALAGDETRHLRRDRRRRDDRRSRAHRSADATLEPRRRRVPSRSGYHVGRGDGSGDAEVGDRREVGRRVGRARSIGGGGSVSCLGSGTDLPSGGVLPHLGVWRRP